jgi:class 3 adenylate cyclase
MDTKNAYIMFTDLKGFSKLDNVEIEIFYNKILKDLSENIIDLKSSSLVWNTWGDALMAIFDDKNLAIELAFKYRDFFRNYNFQKNNIRKLVPRIACHFGEFHIYNDPLLDGKRNALGLNINTTARIEPVTRPNEIYVTKDFKDRIEAEPSLSSFKVSFDELGEIPLAKNFGSYTLYRLRKVDEKEKIADRILKQNLYYMLPEPANTTEEEKIILQHLEKSPSIDILNKSINFNEIIADKNLSEKYLFQIAKIYKNFGLYEESLKVIGTIKNKTQNIDSLNLTLLKYDKELMKLETNCLTRLGRYEEASNLIYGVWQLGNKDSDTLSMLAAQYKRRALFDTDNNLLSKNKINQQLLDRALSLYIEAFRLNIEDYYPAINIAYLYKILGGDNSGKGNRLAQYIIDTWAELEDDWWLASSILECEIIIEDFENLDSKFENIISKYSPSNFDKQATFTQIELYAKLVDIKSPTLGKILKLLKG